MGALAFPRALHSEHRDEMPGDAGGGLQVHVVVVRGPALQLAHVPEILIIEVDNLELAIVPDLVHHVVVSHFVICIGRRRVIVPIPTRI